MATVCPGDFIVLCVPDQQQENSKLNPLHFTSTSQTVSRVKDLLPALSSSSSPWIVTSVMTNALQGQVGQDLRGQWQDPCHVQRQQQLRSFWPSLGLKALWKQQELRRYSVTTDPLTAQAYRAFFPAACLDQSPLTRTLLPHGKHQPWETDSGTWHGTGNLLGILEMNLRSRVRNSLWNGASLEILSTSGAAFGAALNKAHVLQREWGQCLLLLSARHHLERKKYYKGSNKAEKESLGCNHSPGRDGRRGPDTADWAQSGQEDAQAVPSYSVWRYLLLHACPQCHKLSAC